MPGAAVGRARQPAEEPQSRTTGTLCAAVSNERQPAKELTSRTQGAAASSERQPAEELATVPQGTALSSVRRAAEEPQAGTQGAAVGRARPTAEEPQSQATAISARRIYDLQFFRDFSNFTAHHQQHNAALKYFHETLEWTMRESRELNVREVVHDIVHEKGPNYSIHPQSQREWSWLELVAQLQDEDLLTVVEGDDRRSRGLVGCLFSRRPNSYDHKTHHKMKQNAEPQPRAKIKIWDFLLLRDDGTGIRLHPNWKGTKVESFSMEGHAIEVPPPQKGFGESAGPGTFKGYKDIGTERILRFDPRKLQQARSGHDRT